MTIGERHRQINTTLLALKIENRKLSAREHGRPLGARKGKGIGSPLEAPARNTALLGRRC